MKFEEIIKVLWRRKFYILLPLIIVPLFTMMAMMRMTREYQTSSEIFIDESLFRHPILQGFGLKLDLEGRLPTIKKLMKGKESFRYIIGKTGLSPEQASKNMEAMIVELKGPGLTKVTFSGTDPAGVKEVTERMAEKFIEYALKPFSDIGKRLKSGLAGMDEILAKQLLPELYQAEARYEEVKKNFTRQSPEFLDAKYKYETWKAKTEARENVVIKNVDDILPLLGDKLDTAAVTQIVVPARVPPSPFKPDKVKLMVIAVIGSIALGFILVFLMEFLDHSFKESSDVEKYLGLPVLGRIPRTRKIKETRENQETKEKK